MQVMSDAYKKLHAFWYRPLPFWLCYPLYVYNFFYFTIVVVGLLFKAISQMLVPNNLKLIVVTNTTVGGNGKSPTVIYLANHYRSSGLRVAVLASSYKSAINKKLLLVDGTVNSRECGDEALMIAVNTQADVYVGVAALPLYNSIAAMGVYDICITDGSLSDLYYLADQIYWLSDAQVHHNQLAVPLGPLKYPSWMMLCGRRLIKGVGYRDDVCGFDYNDATVLPTKKGSCLSGFESKVVMTAVAKPESVMRTVSLLGLRAACRSYVDHEYFELPEISHSLAIIITEKDWARLNFPSRDDLFVICLRYEPSTPFQEVLHDL